jgi:hypothetical protein
VFVVTQKGAKPWTLKRMLHGKIDILKDRPKPFNQQNPNVIKYFIANDLGIVPTIYV